MSATHFWLRHEVKPNERRTLFTPEACTTLIADGAQISVERSPTRIFPDADYETAGCTLVDQESWESAPEDAYICGLKELPEADTPLKHKHIMFGHAYKNQGGWAEFLNRFNAGNGQLLDLEFLNDANGRRVAAFGFAAGYAGAAVALLAWAQQKVDPSVTIPALDFFADKQALVDHCKAEIEKAVAAGASSPSAIVLGALGRAGRGALALFIDCGVAEDCLTKWDIPETKKGGPFEEILTHDILINCIYLNQPIAPFLTKEMIARESRPLSTLCDVSCDTSNPNNPLPFLNELTYFTAPTTRLVEDPPLDGIAIDHLPSLLPKESSEGFIGDLMPFMRALVVPNPELEPVWEGARKWFTEKSAAAKST